MAASPSSCQLASASEPISFLESFAPHHLIPLLLPPKAQPLSSLICNLSQTLQMDRLTLPFLFFCCSQTDQVKMTDDAISLLKTCRWQKQGGRPFLSFLIFWGAGVVLNMVSLKYILDSYIEMLMKTLNLTLWDSDEGIRLEVYM